MSNKDLLKLENEFRNELPKYKQKPDMSQISRPTTLTKKVSHFLEQCDKAKDSRDHKPKVNGAANSSKVSEEPQVEMDIYLTPI